MMPGLVDDRLNQVPDFSIPDKEFANQDMLEAAGEEFIQMAALNKNSLVERFQRLEGIARCSVGPSCLHP